MYRGSEKSSAPEPSAAARGGSPLREYCVAAARWLDANLEKAIILVAYSTCAGIIAVEVIRRFLLNEQAPWSTTIPAYMFVWLTWPGAALAVRLRAHLSFTEIRERLPRFAQYVVMQFDYLLFIGFAVIAIYYSMDLVQLQIDNSSTVPGTRNVLSWWFYLATPVGWALLVFRVLQNAVDDFSDLRAGRALKTSGGISSID